MKIIVLAGRYGISGVPLAQARFARALAARGNEVELIFGKVNEDSTLPDVEGVRVRTLEKSRVSQMILPLSRHFSASRPDVIFSAGDHLSVIVLMAAMLSGTKAKISCSARVTPFDTYSDRILSKGWVLKQLMRLTMWRADALTCVSADMVKQYHQLFGRTRHACVYNIIDDDSSRNRMAEPLDDPWLNRRHAPTIVAAGSLVPWKGFSDLIVAMREVRRSVPARLIILGEGPQREDLEALVRQHGLEDAVRMPGNVANPLQYFSRADVFVLSSYVEGLPNVLVEAMLCGCTPVSTNCPTGPREVLQDGKFGYLVPVRDPGALARGIVAAVQNPIPTAALAEAVEPFREEPVIRTHLRLLGLPMDAFTAREVFARRDLELTK
jgi:glycosyltransferase involved in cell wall biosynthesis